MDSKFMRRLNIDPEFKALIRPLTEAERAQLEANLLADGCIDPIITWNGVIIDGHNRYELCSKHSIPFAVLEKQFECREEAMAWICAHQLGRRNLSDETRRYLIGIQYESEKVANAQKNAVGANQYVSADGSPRQAIDSFRPSQPSTFSGHLTAQRIGKKNHIAAQTVVKYANYAKSLEVLRSKVPEIVPKILSGEFKISQENLAELALLKPSEIQKVIRGIEAKHEAAARYKGPRTVLQQFAEGKPLTTIKDMPDFDPDAEVVGLALTIPSWASSIDRCGTSTNLESVSAQARKKLAAALSSLIGQAECLLMKMEAESDERS